MDCRKPSILVWLATLLVAARSASAAVTYTVDDGDSSISYFPSEAWSQAPSCTGCSTQPDTSRANGGTWHQATYKAGDSVVPYIEVQFTGTAIHVYNIVVGSASISGVHLQFFWDGQRDRGSGFDWDVGDSGSVQYRLLAYYINGLEHGAHTLRIQPDTSQGSIILLDYVQVTSDNAPSAAAPPQSSDTSTSTFPNSPAPPASPSSTSPSTSIPTSIPTPIPQPTQKSQSGIPVSDSGATNTHSSDSPSLSIASPSSHSFNPTTPLTANSSSTMTGDPSVVATQVDEPRSSAGPSRSPAGVIAGVVIGVLVVLVLVFLGACLRGRRRRRAARPPILPKESEKGSLSVYKTELPPEPSSATRLLSEGRNVDQAISLSLTHTLCSETSYSPTTEHPNGISASNADINLATVPNASDSLSPQIELQNVEPYTSHDLEKAPIVAGAERASAPSEEPVYRLEAGAVVSQAVEPRELPALEVAEEARPAPQAVARHPVSTGSAALHAQLAALEEEVARLREHVDAPPRYE